MPGARWVCTVRPPAPYWVTFTIELGDVIEPEHVEARVFGDIEGWARLTVAPAADGCSIRLVSQLAPRSRTLRALSWVARPLVSSSHDSILASGIRQFAARSRC
jgi:hypothetical protein